MPAATRPRLDLDVADGPALPYDASFDAVFSVSVIEHVPGEGDGAMCAR